MNISSTSNQNSIFGLSNQISTSKKSLVRSIDPVSVKSAQEKALNNQANQSQGVVADEQAIALFEQNQLEASAAKSTANNNAFIPADKDEPLTKNESAVASYQAVGNLAQRESVQQLFGVDIFA